MSTPANDAKDSDDLRAAYRRRTGFLWIVVLIAGLLWYGLTGIESLSMGYEPLVRRPFTLLDWAVYALLVGGIVIAILRIRRCPRCAHAFGIRMVTVCPSCGGRVR